MIRDLFIIGFDQISDHPSDQTGDTNGSIRIRSISDGSPDIRFDRISEHTSIMKYMIYIPYMPQKNHLVIGYLELVLDYLNLFQVLMLVKLEGVFDLTN